jgi:cytochrome c556
MRRWARFLSAAAGATVLLTVVVYAALPEDGQAAFQRREDTMKRMGRPLHLGIGRVVKGTAAYGSDTVTTAETVVSLASTLDRTLFPPGSDVAESKIKPEIFSRQRSCRPADRGSEDSYRTARAYGRER